MLCKGEVSAGQRESQLRKLPRREIRALGMRAVCQQRTDRYVIMNHLVFTWASQCCCNTVHVATTLSIGILALCQKSKERERAHVWFMRGMSVRACWQPGDTLAPRAALNAGCTIAHHLIPCAHCEPGGGNDGCVECEDMGVAQWSDAGSDDVSDCFCLTCRDYYNKCCRYVEWCTEFFLSGCP